MTEIDKIVIGKVGKVWEMKKKILGGKKAVMEATAVVNPYTGRLAVSKEETVRVTLRYCKDTLKNNLPEDDFKKEVEKKKKEMEDYLKQKEGNFKAQKETFDNMIRKFKNQGNKIMTF